MSSVKYYYDNGAGIISLEEGDSGNKLNTECIQLIIEAFDKLTDDFSCRVIFIRSVGKYFCLGMDLVKAAAAGNIKEIESAVKQYSMLLEKLHDSDPVTVALVDGPVKAGGVGVAAACDLVIATDKSDFELSEALLGIIPANVLPYIYMLRLTPQQARYMVLTASRIDADTAVRYGLADEKCVSEMLEKRARAIGKQILRISPEAVKEYKRFAEFLNESEMRDRKKEAVKKIAELLNKKETIDAIKGFNEGMTPSWFSKFKPEKPITGISGE